MGTFNIGPCDCCGGATSTCAFQCGSGSNCYYVAGRFPQFINATLAGFTGFCSAFNGTYRLTDGRNRPLPSCYTVSAYFCDRNAPITCGEQVGGVYLAIGAQIRFLPIGSNGCRFFVECGAVLSNFAGGQEIFNFRNATVTLPCAPLNGPGDPSVIGVEFFLGSYSLFSHNFAGRFCNNVPTINLSE